MRSFICVLIMLGFSLQCVLAQSNKLLQQYLDKADFFSLRDELNKQHAQLSTAEKLYYGAIIHNAFNRNELATRTVDSFYQLQAKGWNPNQLLRLEEMLMDSYAKQGRYKDAARISGIVLEKYTPEGKAGLANTRKIWLALADIPAQSLTYMGDVSLPISKNDIQLFEIPVKFAGSKEEKFIFDTGANISTISETYADKLSLKRLNINFDVSAAQGKKVKSGLAIADSLWIGKALFQNVVFIVMPDDKLNFPQLNVYMNGIIGFPVISAFKEIHISRDGQLTIPSTPDNTRLQNLSLNGLTPLVQAKAGTDTLVFQFDTGAVTTHLFSNYFEKYRQLIKDNSEKQRKKLMSAGGASSMKMYTLPDLRLQIGDDVAKLSDLPIYTRKVHSAGESIAMGNIGQDVIKQFKVMVLNFESMYIDFR